MTLRSALTFAIVFLLVVPAARAQEQSDLWRRFAAGLSPGSFVVVNLKGGKRLQGRVVQVADNTVTILPKTRIAVPARTLAFADVESIDARKEDMSPGAKVLIGAGTAVGILVLLAAVAFGGR